MKAQDDAGIVAAVEDFERSAVASGMGESVKEVRALFAAIDAWADEVPKCHDCHRVARVVDGRCAGCGAQLERAVPRELGANGGPIVSDRTEVIEYGTHQRRCSDACGGQVVNTSFTGSIWRFEGGGIAGTGATPEEAADRFITASRERRRDPIPTAERQTYPHRWPR